MATVSIRRFEKNVKTLWSKNKSYLKFPEHFENRMSKTDIVNFYFKCRCFSLLCHIHLRFLYFRIKVLHFIISSSHHLLFLCFLFIFHFVESGECRIEWKSATLDWVTWNLLAFWQANFVQIETSILYEKCLSVKTIKPNNI